MAAHSRTLQETLSLIDKRISTMSEMIAAMKGSYLGAGKDPRFDSYIVLMQKLLRVAEAMAAILRAAQDGRLSDDAGILDMRQITDESTLQLVTGVALCRTLAEHEGGLAKSTNPRNKANVGCSFCGLKKDNLARGGAGRICHECAVHVAHLFGLTLQSEPH